MASLALKGRAINITRAKIAFVSVKRGQSKRPQLPVSEDVVLVDAILCIEAKAQECFFG